MPSTKVTQNLPIQLANVGSREAPGLDFTREALWKRMDGGMGRKAVQTPVFLANPARWTTSTPRSGSGFSIPNRSVVGPGRSASGGRGKGTRASPSRAWNRSARGVPGSGGRGPLRFPAG